MKEHQGPTPRYISALRSRNALPMTDTELRLMAAAAMMRLITFPYWLPGWA